MLAYILKRIGFAALAVFILLTITYLLTGLLPYRPIIPGQNESEEAFNQRLAALGFNEPIIVRYGKYLYGLFVEHTLGPYYSNGAVNIGKLFFEKVPNTLLISSISFVISIILGISFGVLSAVYRGKVIDTVLNIVSVIFISVPSFVIAVLLLIIFRNSDLPLRFVAPGSNDYTVGKFWASLVLPILSLTLGGFSSMTYYMRNEMVEVLQQDYIKTAKSKGLTNCAIIFKHALRNASIPILSIIVPSLLGLISSSFVIETFYSVPGTASILVDAIQKNEVNMLAFQVLFFSSLSFLLQIVLDVIYTLVDPRIRLAEGNSFIFVKWIANSIARNKNKKLWAMVNESNAYVVSEDKDSSLIESIKENNDLSKTKVFVDNKKFNLPNNVEYIILNKKIYILEKALG
ncbi:ABC transporter permease [Mycoplasma bradburyae]|uniref:ABC transporter permease n=1 Tax=Mycoplasma bradburyae TaxID=2963128 RepID=A0AAW6HRM0_9MOLU|nr:ABC transporter permease [Mycoplasma bradburyae]MDC4163428.1 ABC transporter permease [Mycoplasma bradburyae]MDC4183476.1 ABC transporter permease [Mycoplasma bradburyae]MDC4183860.1 ABC transporter permease [Mycoplasma bradburyae]UTS70627.1 ABC transporter permease [Mycoplasma bradburyae]